jgi:hypothetical protein
MRFYADIDFGISDMSISCVANWNPSGSVCLWRYALNSKHYAGWHITADQAGCTSLLELIDGLSSAAPATFRTLTIAKPTPAILRVVNHRSAPTVTPSKCRVRLSANPSEWYFPPCSDVAELVIGVDWFANLRKGIADIKIGVGDYAIGDTTAGSQELWFWWHPDRTR